MRPSLIPPYAHVTSLHGDVRVVCALHDDYQAAIGTAAPAPRTAMGVRPRVRLRLLQPLHPRLPMHGFHRHDQGVVSPVTCRSPNVARSPDDKMKEARVVGTAILRPRRRLLQHAEPTGTMRPVPDATRSRVGRCCARQRLGMGGPTP